MLKFKLFHFVFKLIFTIILLMHITLLKLINVLK